MTQSGRAGPSELDVGRRRRASSSTRSIGVVKADIGIKDGRIVGVGRAGNPAISDGIELDDRPAHRADHGLRPDRDAGRGRQPRPLDQPELLPAALSGGVTTLITAGFEEPPWAMERTLAGARVAGRSTSGCRPCARSEDDGDARRRSLEAGAVGFKIHEDYGAYPELIDATLRVRRRARRRGLAPHRRPARVGRARGHGRRDRRPDRPRLPRRGHRRRPRAGPARPRPRAEHHVLVDDADDAVRRQRRRPSTCR